MQKRANPKPAEWLAAGGMTSWFGDFITFHFLELWLKSETRVKIARRFWFRRFSRVYGVQKYSIFLQWCKSKSFCFVTEEIVIDLPTFSIWSGSSRYQTFFKDNFSGCLVGGGAKFVNSYVLRYIFIFSYASKKSKTKKIKISLKISIDRQNQLFELVKVLVKSFGHPKI